MCGITGIIDFKRRTEKETLIKMTKALAHRGPDDYGVYFDELDEAIVGLGQTRLSIIDLSEKGHQPIYFKHWVIIFNGEIYNYQEISEQLRQLGHSFDSGSDTEVIIKAFDQWGPKAVDKFIGMFAFVIFDKAQRELYIFRDRAGVKPLFYSFQNGLLLFGSELKSLFEHKNYVKEIDYDNLSLFLQYNYVPTPYSIFKNTFKLAPGHFLKLTLKTQKITTEKYWSIEDTYNQPKLDISYQEALIELERLLISSFKYRMVSDVPVGTFLSGGYDSTAVAAILQANHSGKLKTFTIGYDESEFDESHYAKKVANYIGTDHHQKIIGPNDVKGIIEKLPFVYDEPFSDNSVVPTLLVSQFARQHVKVALSGDAGDEIFAGYDKFNRSLSFTKYPSMVQSLLSGTMGLINPERIPFLSKTYNFPARYEKMKRIWTDKSPDKAMKLISQYMTAGELDKYLRHKPIEKNTYFDIADQLNNSIDPLNKLLAIDYKTFLMDNNLAKVDRATMAFGLEGREPFLDQRIIEFASRLPSEFKIRNGRNKSILKDIVHKYVPKELMDRPKMPFLAPLSKWFSNDLKEYYLDYISPERIEKDGIFSSEIIQLRDRFLSGEKINNQKLWNVLVFQMWKDKWC